MSAVSTGARIAMLDVVSRVVVGGGIPPRDRDWIRAELRLSGFRKTARSYLLRRMAAAGLAQGRVAVVFRALDSFTIACSATDFGVGWDLLETGRYEPHVTAFYRRTLEPGMCVADIGANIGFHALHAAVLVGPRGRVVAVEPDPQSAALLRLGLEVNEPALSVEVIEAALSDRSGEIVQSDLGNAGNSGARFTHHDPATLRGLVHGIDPVFRTARAIVWDEAFSDVPLDFVKIDIEGYEPHAMRGMERSLARHRPIVLSEFAPSNLRSLGGIAPEDYVRWFLERGYACSVLSEPDGDLVSAEPGALLASLGGRHHLDLVFTPAGSSSRRSVQEG